MILPQTWTSVRIEETLSPFENGQTLRQGWSPQCERFAAQTDDDWGVLKTTAIQDGEFQPEHNKQLPASLSADQSLEVEAGDLLLTCAGPRSRCGVICLVRNTRPRLMISGKMYRFRPESRLTSAAYLEAFLRSHDTKKLIDAMKTGISDSGLNLTLARFKTLVVPLPPLREQQRIVAKIEELFSELDEGIENLKLARAQLAVYRQALLKHAFEGKLTADWRAVHADQRESREQFLQRIRVERESRNARKIASSNTVSENTEQNVDELSAAKLGKTKDRESIKDGDINELSDLPLGWYWCSLDELLAEGPLNGYSPKGVSFETATKAITLTATTSGTFDGSHFKYLDVVVPDDSPLWLNAGDILIQRGNTIEYVGVPAIYKGMSKEFIYPDLMMKIRVTSQTNSDYLTFAISDTRARSHMRSRAVGAAGSMPKINHSILKSLPIPVCPLKEQEEIVRILNRSFSVIEKNSVDLDNQILRAEALRQSILKRAFAGELVPQDPSEEPAAALLARVRAECAVSAAPKTKSKKTRAAKA